MKIFIKNKSFYAGFGMLGLVSLIVTISAHAEEIRHVLDLGENQKINKCIREALDALTEVSSGIKYKSLEMKVLNLELNRGVELRKEGRWIEAEEAFTRLLYSASHDDRGVAELVEMFIRKGDLAAAEKTLNKSAQRNLENPLWLASQARLSMLRNQLKSAEEYLLKALSINPDSAEAIAGMADLKVKKALWFEAAELATKALDLDPSLVRPHLILGQHFKRKGNYETAKFHLAQAAELAGTGSDAETAQKVLNEFLSPLIVKEKTKRPVIDFDQEDYQSSKSRYKTLEYMKSRLKEVREEFQKAEALSKQEGSDEQVIKHLIGSIHGWFGIKMRLKIAAYGRTLLKDPAAKEKWIILSIEDCHTGKVDEQLMLVDFISKNVVDQYQRENLLYKELEDTLEYSCKNALDLARTYLAVKWYVPASRRSLLFLKIERHKANPKKRTLKALEALWDKFFKKN